MANLTVHSNQGTIHFFLDLATFFLIGALGVAIEVAKAEGQPVVRRPQWAYTG